MYLYAKTEIENGSYAISCPDMECCKDTLLSLDVIEKLVGKELSDRHRAFRLNAGETN